MRLHWHGRGHHHDYDNVAMHNEYTNSNMLYLLVALPWRVIQHMAIPLEVEKRTDDDGPSAL